MNSPFKKSRVYMMAVGGAGSSGWPALASGSLIMSTARPISTTTASRSVPHHVRSGRIFVALALFGGAEAGHNQPAQGFARDQAGSGQYAVFSMRAFCASLKPPLSRSLSVPQRKRPPTKMAKVVSSGRYIPTENSMGLFTSTRIRRIP